MRRKSILLAAVVLVLAAVVPVQAATEQSVLDVLRGATEAQPTTEAQPACQNQICNYVPATGGNPGHYNCKDQSNSKCFPSEDALECTSKICRTPTTGTPASHGDL